MVYQETIEYLYDLQWHGIKLGLSNIQKMMDLFEQPQTRFKSIHIAGTNGKGSTAAMISSILQCQGYRVGLYTSPHLIDFTERIRIDGKEITQERVVEISDRIRKQISASLEEITPTFFEFTTAMAFVYFAEEGIDVGVIETGMGGRLDATNIIRPMVSVITNIDYDHQFYLGNSIEEIAFEKAGIIKRSVPVVTSTKIKEAIEVIEKRSLEMETRALLFGRDFKAIKGIKPDLFNFYGKRWKLFGLAVGLLGEHQIINAATSLAALEQLSVHGIEINEDAIRKGLKDVIWEGRLEKLMDDPLIILDGAHNPAGADVLSKYLARIKEKRKGRLILVLGVMKDKDITAIFKNLLPLADEVVITKPDYHRSAGTGDLENILAIYKVNGLAIENVKDAVVFARDSAKPEDTICVTGSLFTVGEARAFLVKKVDPSLLKG